MAKEKQIESTTVLQIRDMARILIILNTRTN